MSQINQDLETGVKLLQADICQQLSLANDVLSSISYESEVIAAVQYKVVLKHKNNKKLVNVEILQKLTQAGSQYYLNDANFISTDVSENLGYLEKIGNLLEVGKLFNEVKEIDLHKDGFVSYGFSVEHTEKNEIPGYILLKVTKISNDASQTVLHNLRVGDFILKVDEKVVCTCNAKDKSMVDSELIFEGVGSSMKVVVARKLKNGVSVESDDHQELVNKYRTTKLVELSGENGDFGVKTAMDGDMVMVSELCANYHSKVGGCFLSVGDHILNVNNKSVLEFDLKNRHVGINSEMKKSGEFCVLQAGSNRCEGENSKNGKNSKNDENSRNGKNSNNVENSKNGVKSETNHDDALTNTDEVFPEPENNERVGVENSESEDEDEIISPEEEAMMLKMRREGRRLTIIAPADAEKRMKELARKMIKSESPDEVEAMVEELVKKYKNVYTNKQFNLIKIAWDYFDRDQDGFIARQEFHNFMSDDIVTKRIGQLPASLIDPIFDDIDIDQTGFLDLFEFLTIIKEDDNGDLLISFTFKKF